MKIFLKLVFRLQSDLNTEHYIAKRMLKGGSSSKKISKPIVSLAIIGITLGIAVMILSISIASGFQQEIRDKVIGFGSHIQITGEYNNSSFESTPILSSQPFLDDILAEDQVYHVQSFAYKPAIIQSRKPKGIEDFQQDILGIIFKGVDKEFDATFFQDNLIEDGGRIPGYTDSTTSDSILVSRYIANKLKLKVNDKVSTFFVKEDGPKQRNLIVSGIYETGMEDFDKQFAIIDINHIRKLNNWGITASLFLRDECKDSMLYIEARVTGGNENHRCSWNGGSYSETFEIPFCPIKDTVIKLVANDFESYSYLEPIEEASIADTAWLTINVESVNDTNCYCEEEDMFVDFESMDDGSLVYTFNGNKITTKLRTSGGSSKYYVGGFEVLLNDYKDLEDASDIAQKHTSHEFNVSTIIERNEEIFNWLNMLDMNVYIIIVLMILVAIINMTSALLVLILERTQMIGILKSLGGNDWSIRKIFLYNGGYLITRGIILGNALALAIILLQNQFQIIQLPPENYYVNVVPMNFDILPILLVNIGAFIICFLALILPSYMVTRISPVKAIKFE